MFNDIIKKLSLRELQIESSLALQILQTADNLSLSKINQKVDHNSTLFYKGVLEEFLQIYQDLPSNTEAGKKIKLIYPK